MAETTTLNTAGEGVTAPAEVGAERPAEQHKSKVLLPPNLAHLAKLAAKDKGRYAVNAIRLEVNADGSYRAVATDGRSIGIVDGHPDKAEDYPDLSALAAAPNGATSALVELGAWQDAFKLIPKKTFQPILQNVAAVMGENVTTFATTDLDREKLLAARNVEGWYPDYRQATPKGPPKATVRVNPEMLAELLRVASEYDDEGMPAVTLEVYGDGVPMVVRSRNAHQQFTGMLMPLA